MTGPYFELFVPPSQWHAREAVAASGVTLTFDDGSEAICGISGLWNASLGYGNRAVADAVHRANLEAATLPIFRRGSVHARRAAERLLDFARPHDYASVLFSTSGSAAVDATVKLARHVQVVRGEVRRRRVVSLVGSYHGMTIGAMGLTGSDVRQDVYGADTRLNLKVPHDDVVALGRVLDRFGPEIAAVVIEPVLGSGALPVPHVTLERLVRGRAEHGYLLVADEVATGFHRTGPAFASHTWPTAPDLLITSKALTNGTCAASAVLVARDVMAELAADDSVYWHGETQAGSPQHCAAIVATLDEIARLDVPALVARQSVLLDEVLAGWAALSPWFSTTGAGSMRALHVAPEAAASDPDLVARTVRECLDAGAVVQPGPSCVQVLPAFTMTGAELRTYAERVGGVLARLAASLPQPTERASAA